MANFNFQRKLSRRTVLRGAGVALTLPWLNAMTAAFADSSTAQPPWRFVAMTTRISSPKTKAAITSRRGISRGLRISAISSR